MEEVLLYELGQSIIKKGSDRNYPFCEGKSKEIYYSFKEYVRAIFSSIGLVTYRDSYLYDFNIIQIEVDNKQGIFEGKVIFENQECKIVFDDELRKIYYSFIGKDIFKRESCLFDIEKDKDAFQHVNKYINIKHQYYINLVLCEKDNNKLIFYGYCLKDISKLCKVIGSEGNSEEKFNLYDVNPLLDCLFYKLTILWYKKTFLELNEKNISRQIQHLLTESVEMLYSKLKLPELDCINIISSLAYESAKCNSTLLFDSNVIEDSTRNEIIIEFKSPVIIELEECRKIRKYLQMAQGDVHLVATVGWRSQIIGLVQNTKKVYSTEIRFKGHMKWELYIKGRVVVEYENGQYRFIYSNDKEKKYLDRIQDYLQCDENDFKCKKLVDIICRAEEQNHGTLIIFTNKAKNIAQHYCKCGRGIEIEPTDLHENKEMIYNLTAIDGALIVDDAGVCYGLGVILDGEARMYSNPGRGARYNSAYTFIANKIEFNSEDSRWINQDERYIAVVISEDKTVDIITNTDIITPYIMYEIEMNEARTSYDDGLDLLY